MLLAQSTSVIRRPFVPKSAAVLSQLPAAMQAKVVEGYDNLPLSFEANHGQIDAQVKFLSRANGYSLFLTGNEAVLELRGKKKSLPRLEPSTSLSGSGGTAENVLVPRTKPTTESMTGSVLRMKLRNANPAAKVTGGDELPGTSNYFIGNDPAKWRTNVSTYAKVKYEGIYSGIDLVYYGNQRQLEYDFIVAPGADPRGIVFDISGARRIRQDGEGDLVLTMSGGEIRWHKPFVYQEKNGARQEIAAHYTITNKSRVGFRLAEYDAGRPVYIDPLIYSTYLGGVSEGSKNLGPAPDHGTGIAVDSAGNAYVTGKTWAADFPTKNPLQPDSGDGGSDAFVAKINSAGTALVYSTYLGGNNEDGGSGIAVDSAGNAYVTGFTESSNFPTKNPLQPANRGSINAFVAKFNPSGSALVYSTYLGGAIVDVGSGIASDNAGNAYVTGGAGSPDFPTTPGAFQTVCPGAFIAKINPAGSAFVYSTCLGVSAGGTGIAVDSDGNAYVTGVTGSDLPTMNPLQPTYAGGVDAFVAKMNSAGSALVYSTYLGGSGYDGGGEFDNGPSIAVDAAGNAYVTGFTLSTDFPTMNPFQPANGGGGDAFVAKINPEGSALVYSTYLGGNKADRGTGIAADNAGNAYITGSTWSFDFPTLNPLQHIRRGTADAFVAKLNATGSALAYSTYLGGSGLESSESIAVDSTGNAYVTGSTYSTDFPTMNPLQPTYAGGGDAFVAKLFLTAGTATTLLSSPDPSTYGQAVTFTAAVTSALGAPPDAEPVTFMTGSTILGTGALSGGTATFTTTALPVGAGANPITAVYGGDSNFANSTSKVLKQAMKKATTTTTLSSSPNPSTLGRTVRFTAVVTSNFGTLPDGYSVTLMKGTTVLRSKPLSGGSAIFAISGLPVGANLIKAVYSGNSDFAGSTSTAVKQVVK
jgi:hypothetical protein